MKIVLIIIALQESHKQAENVVKYFRGLNIRNFRSYIVINQREKEGYARGVNKGIKKAQKFHPDLYIVANPDIDLLKISKASIMRTSKKFDVWGYAFQQGDKTYYKGKIDPNRLTGGLSTTIPRGMYVKSEFVSGSLIIFTETVRKKIGSWDEKYHMYYEDVDFCMRAREQGFKVGIVNRVSYRHLENSQYNPDKEFQLMKSWSLYFRKYAGIGNWVYEIFRFPKTAIENRGILWRELFKRPFIYNFLTLNFSSFTIKVLNFILFLFLVRYFNVYEFGLYNLVWAQITLFMPLADMGTTNYGIFHLDKSDQKGFSKLFMVRIVLSIFFAAITLAYVFIVFDQKELFILTVVSTPVMLANAVSGSFLIYTTLIAKSYLASVYSLLFNTTLIGILIGLVASKNGLFTLFLVEGIWFGLYGVVLWLKTGKMIKLRVQLPSFQYLRLIAQKSYMYILLNFFAGLYFKIDLLIIQFFKGFQAVGVYSAGYKFFEALIFLGSSYTIAATPIYKQFLSSNPKAIKHKILRDSSLLFLIGIFIAVSSWFLAPVILPAALGTEFMRGIDVFRIVIFALPFLLVSAVCMNVLYILKKTSWVVGIFMLQIILNISFNILFVPLFSYQASAIITVGCEILNATITLPLVLKAYETNTQSG